VDGNTPGSAPGWLSLREAAQQLCVSERTVRRRIHAGTLEAERAVGAFGPEYRIAAGVVATAGRQTVTITPLPSTADPRQFVEAVAAILSAQLAPLHAELAALRSAVERLEAENRALLSAAQDAAGSAEPPAIYENAAESSPPAPTPSTRRWWRFWR
jgi:excisionase family DNA binding protein